MKKNHIRTLIVLALVTVFLGTGALFAKRYYDNHYVASDSLYAVVPMDYDTTPKALLDMKGNEVGIMGTDYQLTAYNEAGDSQIVEFTLRDGYNNIFEPGQYVSVTVNNAGVVMGQKAISAADVPATVSSLLG